MKNGQLTHHYDDVRIMFSRYIDEHGNPVKKTKDKYAYSYDGFVTFRGGENKEANCTIYSDRILYEPMYNKLCKKHFNDAGQMFFNRQPKNIEAFLRDLLNDPKLKLILVMEYCNVSNGYPLWRFDVKQTIK